MSRYLVRRHSGARTAVYRTVLETDDHARAQSRFRALSATLRQGAIVLFDTLDDRELARCGAPRLRTRW